jgi:hypothetical protein
VNPDERRLLGYANLAAIARERGQHAGANRFLVLAGIAACRAGLLDVAERCRSLVVADNPRHVVARYETLADALRDADFDPFRRSLERECPWERSEHVLSELGIDLEDFDAAGDLRAAALAALPNA